MYPWNTIHSHCIVFQNQLKLFDQFRGNPSWHVALPEAKLSMALLSSSTNGSKSSMMGRHSMASMAAGDMVFSLE